MIAARGTSDNVARYAQHLFGRFLGLPVALATPSLTTLYGSGPRLEQTLVIGISQSGQSPDVCAVVQDAREQGQPTIAITNAPASPLARTAEATIDIDAGVEQSVAATKTYTASLAAVAALTAEMSGERVLRAELASIPASMRGSARAGDRHRGEFPRWRGALRPDRPRPQLRNRIRGGPEDQGADGHRG